MPEDSTQQVYRTHHRDEEYWTERPAKKGKPRGRPFAKGYDSRRHRFTSDECSRGFWSAITSIVARYPNAIMRDGRHIACRFLHSKQEQVF